MQLFTSSEQYLTRTLQTKFFLRTVLPQRNSQATKQKTKQAMQTQGQDYFLLRMNDSCFWDSIYGDLRESIPCFHQWQMPQHDSVFWFTGCLYDISSEHSICGPHATFQGRRFHNTSWKTCYIYNNSSVKDLRVPLLNYSHAKSNIPRDIQYLWKEGAQITQVSRLRKTYRYY